MYFINNIFNFNSKLFKEKGSIITIGVFDGVHRGHQSIIEKVALEGLSKNLISTVITFYPHPLKIISKDSPKLIYSLEDRLGYIKKLGINKVLVINFNKEIANLSPEDFISQILIKKLNLQKIWVGKDHTFGIKQRGNVALLKEMGKKYHFEVGELSPLKLNNTNISSSVIRSILQDGEIEKASKFLNRLYCLKGNVVKGSKRGKRIGYPTANIDFDKELITPKNGVYATFVKYKNKFYQSITNIGIRPTFKEEKLILETHLLNFSKDIYEEKLYIYFVKKIREEICFDKEERLIKQIDKDKTLASKILSKKDIFHQLLKS